jgi:CRISPR/Cas system-associated exonuclease Cas4 (RecB family)
MPSMFGDGLIVSISQLKAYLRCSEAYRHRYVLGTEPAFVPLALAFGSAFHTALARFYLAKQDRLAAPAPEELVEAFKGAFEEKRSGPIPLQGEDEEDEPKTDPLDLAARMLTKFHEVSADKPVSVEGIEQPFAVSLLDPISGEVLEEQLVGVIDLLVREEGRLVVVEHKSAAKRYTLDQLKFDFQLTGYKLALQEAGQEDIGLRFQIVTKTKNPQVQIEDVVRTPQDESDFRRTAVGVLRAIDAGAFFPMRGWQCRTCPFEHACTAGRS